MEDKEISYNIERRLGALSVPGRNGWTKELNLVAWNGREPKFDLREWAPDHEKMGKGITFTHEEAENLLRILESNLV